MQNKTIILLAYFVFCSIFCYCQEIVSIKSVELSKISANNYYLIDLKKRNNDLEITTHCILSCRSIDSLTKQRLNGRLIFVEKSTILPKRVIQEQSLINFYPSIKFGKVATFAGLNTTDTIMEVKNLDLGQFLQNYPQLSYRPVWGEIRQGGSGFKIKNNTLSPEFHSSSIVIGDNGDFTSKEVIYSPNKEENAKRFTSFLPNSSPMALIHDSVYQTIYKKYIDEEKWSQYRNFSIVTFDNSGRILNEEAVKFNFMRSTIFRDFVYNEKNEPVGVGIIFGKLLTIGGKELKDSLENRYNFIFTDLKGKIVQNFEFLHITGKRGISPYFIKTKGNDFELFNLNSENAGNPSIEKLTIGANHKYENYVVDSYANFARKSIKIADNRTEATVGIDNVFSISSANTRTVARFFDERNGDVYLIRQAIEDKLEDVKSESTLKLFGTVFILKIDSSLKKCQQFIIEKIKQKTPATIDRLYSENGYMNFLISDFGQKIISIKNDGIAGTLDLNPIYCLIPKQYGLQKNYLYHSHNKRFFFVYQNLKGIFTPYELERQFPEEKNYYLALPNIDNVLKFHYDAKYSSLGSIVEVKLP